MRVRYTDPALEELDEIFSFIASHNPTAASGLVNRIEEITALLSRFPYIGRIRYGNVYMYPLGKYPFLVFYKIEHQTLWVVSIRHAKRKN